METWLGGSRRNDFGIPEQRTIVRSKRRGASRDGRRGDPNCHRSGSALLGSLVESPEELFCAAQSESKIPQIARRVTEMRSGWPTTPEK